jgi:selenium-binding protein 1
LDTKPDPAHPKLVRTIEAVELANRAGYSRPHTVHCGPEGIYVSALADAEGKRPGGVFLMDHESFDVLGRWELDRGPQELAYDGIFRRSISVKSTNWCSNYAQPTIPLRPMASQVWCSA